MLIARRAMNKGSINCLIIQNPPAGQSLAQPRIILEIGQDAASGQVLKALADIGGALFDEAMQPDGSAQASLYIAPYALDLSLFASYAHSSVLNSAGLTQSKKCRH